jgi:glycosyltransferase involved in cell wall biosynthesis
VELANELSRQGHDVAMLLRRRPRESHRQMAFDKLRSAVCAQIWVFEASRATPVVGLWHALAVFRPDIVHAHHERAVRLASRHARRTPVIATIHAHFTTKDFSACDGLICLTDTEANDIPRSYRGLVRVICNWVLPHERPAEAILAARRAEFGIAAGDYVVGAVCRLEPVKGVAGLVIAFHAAGLPSSRLLLVGDGSLRTELEQLAARLGLGDRVTFAGFRHDVRDLYYLFDVFVLNSLDEPFGLVVLEAAASGLPVIATATPGPLAMAETLPLELLRPGDPDLLAAALARVRGRSPPAYDLSDFTVEAKVQATVAAYRQVIDAKRPARGLRRNQRRAAPNAAW